MNVSEIMTRTVHACRMDDSVSVAAQLMWENDCGAIPVVNEDGRVVAMITDRDICMAAYTQGRPLREIAVRSAASRSVTTVCPEDSLHRVEQLMSQAQVRRVPVVDPEGRPVGILSITDLARLTSALGSATASHLMRTMVSVCRKHSEASTIKEEQHSTAAA